MPGETESRGRRLGRVSLGWWTAYGCLIFPRAGVTEISSPPPILVHSRTRHHARSRVHGGEGRRAARRPPRDVEVRGRGPQDTSVLRCREGHGILNSRSSPVGVDILRPGSQGSLAEAPAACGPSGAGIHTRRASRRRTVTMMGPGRIGQGPERISSEQTQAVLVVCPPPGAIAIPGTCDHIAAPRSPVSEAPAGFSPSCGALASSPACLASLCPSRPGGRWAPTDVWSRVSSLGSAPEEGSARAHGTGLDGIDATAKRTPPSKAHEGGEREGGGGGGDAHHEYKEVGEEGGGEGEGGGRGDDLDDGLRKCLATWSFFLKWVLFCACAQRVYCVTHM